MSVMERSEETPHARYLATRSFGSLDRLRGLSILGVLWHHTSKGTSGDFPIADRGFLGVDLFFVISGFLITTLLVREHQTTGTISLRAFYIRRFLRIFPPYYGLLLALSVVVLLPGVRSAASISRDLPYAFFYVSNMVPMASLLAITWSLSTEEQFYLLVPALHKVAPRFVPLAILPLAYVVVSLPTFGLFPRLELPDFFRQTTFGPILLGVALAHLLNTPQGDRLASGILGWRWAALMTLGLVLIACNHPAPDISGAPRLAIHASLVLLVAACVLREDHALEGCLRFWPLRRLGTVSYGIYHLEQQSG